MSNPNLPNSSDHQSSLQTENEKKYLPSETDRVKLKDGTDIFQFYFPADKLSISSATRELFHSDYKLPLFGLSYEELLTIESFIASRKHPKARLRLANKGGQKQAFFNMKLDLRDKSKPRAASEGHIISNSEFEREIDYKLAAKIFSDFQPHTHSIIYKTRYLIEDFLDESLGAKPFEFDLFHGPLDVPNPDRRIADNSGAIIIEKELPGGVSPLRENLPPWIGEDITHDPRFTNSQLSQKPYARWNEQDKPPVLQKIKHFYS